MIADGLFFAGRPPVIPGSIAYTSNNTFVVPNYNTLIVELVGGGGSGATHDTVEGTSIGHAGTATTFAAPTGTLTAGGGGAGNASNSPSTGGSASGGDTNTTGGAGTTGGGGAGAGPFGGAPENAPGGGTQPFGDLAATGGGGGGYTKKTYTAGSLIVGSSISVAIGAGGAASLDTAPGARGEARISWS